MGLAAEGMRVGLLQDWGLFGVGCFAAGHSYIHIAILFFLTHHISLLYFTIFIIVLLFINNNTDTILLSLHTTLTLTMHPIDFYLLHLHIKLNPDMFLLSIQ